MTSPGHVRERSLNTTGKCKKKKCVVGYLPLKRQNRLPKMSNKDRAAARALPAWRGMALKCMEVPLPSVTSPQGERVPYKKKDNFLKVLGASLKAPFKFCKAFLKINQTKSYWNVFSLLYPYLTAYPFQIRWFFDSCCLTVAFKDPPFCIHSLSFHMTGMVRLCTVLFRGVIVFFGGKTAVK